MATKKAKVLTGSLTVKDVLRAEPGLHSDGPLLKLRVKNGSANWIFRYHSNGTGKREEVYRGRAHPDDKERPEAAMQAARMRSREMEPEAVRAAIRR